MLRVGKKHKIYLYLCPVDLRKAINGLSALVVDELGGSPGSGDLYIFYNRARNKLKILLWDRTGFVLYYKRLERRTLLIPRDLNTRNLVLTEEQLSWLLHGLEFTFLNRISQGNDRIFY